MELFVFLMIASAPYQFVSLPLLEFVDELSWNETPASFNQQLLTPCCQFPCICLLLSFQRSFSSIHMMPISFLDDHVSETTISSLPKPV